MFNTYDIEKSTDYDVIQIHINEHVDLSELLFELTKLVSEPGYFVIDVEKTSKGKHFGEYFLNGLTQSYFMLLFEMYKDLLINERGITFGYCSHEGINQVIIDSQKQIKIYTNRTIHFEETLKSFGFTIFHENPSIPLMLALNTSTIYFPNETLDDMIDALHMYGLYLNKNVI